MKTEKTQQNIAIGSQLPENGEYPPILTKEEEYDLAKKLFENNDLEAAKTLVMSHMRFVAYVASEYNGYGLERNDLIQEGSIGLMKAVKKFNPYKDVRLSTYAVYWIRAEIHDFIFKNWRIVKIATTKTQRKLFFKLNKARIELSESLSKDDIKEIAKDLSVPERDVIEMESRLKFRAISLEANPEDESSEFRTNLVQLPDPDSEISENIIIEMDEQSYKNRKMFEAISRLTEKEQDIINSRFFKETTLTLSQIADKYEVSIEAIRQQQKKILMKLKEEF